MQAPKAIELSPFLGWTGSIFVSGRSEMGDSIVFPCLLCMARLGFWTTALLLFITARVTVMPGAN
jgi:hypothetical protein